MSKEKQDEQLWQDKWLPAESWLVVGSLFLGIVLLGVMLWLSNSLFPITRVS